MRRLAAILALLFLLGAVPGWAETVERGTIEAEPGVRLYYERIGHGPDVVLVPGRFLFSSDVGRLVRPERSLVFYDMRNRGLSSRVDRDEAISIQADVRDLEAVRRHFGAERVGLLGYSYLGLMTALYALEHPQRVERLVQIGPVPIRFGTEFPDDLAWSDPRPVISAEALAELERLREEGMDAARPRDFCLRSERLSRLRLAVDPAAAERVDIERRCAMANEWPVNLRRHLRIHFAGSVQNLALPMDSLRRLDLPVLTIHGRKDRNAPFAGGAQWAMTFPNARFVAVPEAAHQVWLDAPEVLDDVDAFLAGQWPESAVAVRHWDDVRRLLALPVAGAPDVSPPPSSVAARR